MRKATSLILVILIISTFHSEAQILLDASQIKDITIHNASAGMMGGTTVDIKVVPQGGKWNSYLSRKSSNSVDRDNKSYDSVMHRFITAVDPKQLTKMLISITVQKPGITSSTFNITPQALINEITSGAKAPVTKSPDLYRVITQTAIDSAISKIVIKEEVMDAFGRTEVDIVTVKNDTVKISSDNLCPTKLPWTINKRYSYDSSVNNFVVAAIGNEDIPNKRELSISFLKESICKLIDGNNPGAPIATFRWNYYYPKSLKALTDNFSITESLSYGDVYTCLLKSKGMPSNAALEAHIDMKKKNDIAAVIIYARLIDQYFKANSFVFNYYKNRPDTHIGFAYFTDIPLHHSLAYLGKKLPQCEQQDSSKIVDCWISAPDDSSRWTFFPDNKVLLFYHSVTTPHGETAPIYPSADKNDSWVKVSQTWYLFNDKGKVLQKGLGL